MAYILLGGEDMANVFVATTAFQDNVISPRELEAKTGGKVIN